MNVDKMDESRWTFMKVNGNIHCATVISEAVFFTLCLVIWYALTRLQRVLLKFVLHMIYIWHSDFQTNLLRQRSWSFSKGSSIYGLRYGYFQISKWDQKLTRETTWKLSYGPYHIPSFQLIGKHYLGPFKPSLGTISGQSGSKKAYLMAQKIIFINILNC